MEFHTFVVSFLALWCIGWITRLVYAVMKRNSNRGHLEKLCEKAKTNRDRKVQELREKLEKIKEDKWKEIVHTSTTLLLEKLRAGIWKPVDVLHAFQWQSLEAQQATNCVTTFFDEAEEWARDLENKFEELPLYGLPFAVKENLQMKGYDCTKGFAQYLDHPATGCTVLVESLQKLGAVPFAHTNVPQSLLSWTSCNPIYGLTTNPFSEKRTAGGSSGGSGAIVALHGCPFALGTDTGGSVRTPAHFCGITALKPTMARITKKGMIRAGIAPGVVGLCGGPGPMAKDVDTLTLVLRNLWMPNSYQFQQDPYVTPLPFQQELFSSKEPLKIGYYYDDGYLPVVPACRRAVEEAVEMLKSKGHALVEWTPPDMWEAVRLARVIVNMGGDRLAKTLSKDIPEPRSAVHYDLLTGDKQWRHCVAKIFSRYHPRKALYLKSVARNVEELRDTYDKIGHYKANFLREWQKAGLDCLVCPVAATVAPPVDLISPTFSCTSYAVLYNLLDYPAGSVPVTRVTQEDESQTEMYIETDEQTSAIKSACLSESVGLPVGVQCVALPNRDEICLRLMSEIENLL